MQVRLQKIIASTGIASRRKAEELITQGRVQVNGEVVTQLGAKADPESDSIKVSGKRVTIDKGPRLYVMLNKPRACISTTSDPEGRRTVMDLLGPYRSKLYPVGRLDYASEGLLLFTNDGEFANHLLSTKSHIPKTYLVKIKGNPSRETVLKLQGGIKLDGGMTAPARVRLARQGANPWFEVILTEGRNQQIRRMFRNAGFLVEKIKRVRIGSLRLGRLPAGKHRPLTAKEVQRLRTASPARQAASPARRTAGPARRTASPARRTASPAQRTASPARRTASPARQAASPARRTASPARRTAGPARRTASPARRTAGPARRTASPAQRTASPAQRTASPAQRTASPARRSAERPTRKAGPTKTGKRKTYRRK
jgi:23S rRNA pseudouridine2605 synthase